MPTYEFLCEKCKKSFELRYSLSEYERAKNRKTTCPKCGSSKVVRKISPFEVKTAKKS